LHSLKNAPVHVVRWYAKKLQRLIVPLYIFLAFLAIVCMLMIVPTSVEKIVKYNMNLVQSAGKSPLRSEFYAYAEENTAIS